VQNDTIWYFTRHVRTVILGYAHWYFRISDYWYLMNGN